MVTIKQKPIVDWQKKKRRELKHITKGNHHFTKEVRKRRRKGKENTKQPESNKIVWVPPYLS